MGSTHLLIPLQEQLPAVEQEVYRAHEREDWSRGPAHCGDRVQLCRQRAVSHHPMQSNVAMFLSLTGFVRHRMTYPTANAAISVYNRVCVSSIATRV